MKKEVLLFLSTSTLKTLDTANYSIIKYTEQFIIKYQKFPVSDASKSLNLLTSFIAAASESIAHRKYVLIDFNQLKNVDEKLVESLIRLHVLVLLHQILQL